MMKKLLLLLVLSALTACGHSQVTNIGLVSFGDLEGKEISEGTKKSLSGKSCGYGYKLSDAVRDALKETDYDTLVNVQVVNETGLFVWSNCLKVTGDAINSKTLAQAGGK